MEMANPNINTPTTPVSYGPKLSPLRHVRWGLVQLALLVFTATLSYGCYLLCRGLIVQSVEVKGSSMAPTLLDSERFLLNRVTYHFRDPQQRDIVVLRDPWDGGYAVKRIVAGPGDSVYVKNGHVFVNNQILHESYLPTDTQTYAGPDYTAQYWICGANQYFVLGDNRNNSADSRNYGVISRESILGLVTP
jgi:signal peptidase I